jgi:uncharacterized protein YcfJ
MNKTPIKSTDPCLKIALFRRNIMRLMTYITATSTMVTALLLVACQTMPSGPSVAVMPAQGKSFDVFRVEDRQCRDYAASSVSSGAQSANNSAVGTAVIGAVLGTAVGALAHNAGAGAAVGLAGGSLVGAGNAQNSTFSSQQRYDIAYEQCMYTHGNQLPPPAQRSVIYRSYAPYPY